MSLCFEPYPLLNPCSTHYPALSWAGQKFVQVFPQYLMENPNVLAKPIVFKCLPAGKRENENCLIGIILNS